MSQLTDDRHEDDRDDPAPVIARPGRISALRAVRLLAAAGPVFAIYLGAIALLVAVRNAKRDHDVAAAFGGLWERSAEGERGAATADSAAEPTYTREQLQQLLMGTTEEEVLNLLGEPAVRSAVAPIWEYRGIVYDARTGRIIAATTVTFTNGRVVDVS